MVVCRREVRSAGRESGAEDAVVFGVEPGANAHTILALVDNPNERADWQVMVNPEQLCFVGRNPDGGVATFVVADPELPLPDALRVAGADASGGAYILAVYTARELRGRGLARSCLEFACEQLRERGVHYVWLKVRSDNAPARKCYNKSGFREVGQIHQVSVFGRRTSERIERAVEDR